MKLYKHSLRYEPLKVITPFELKESNDINELHLFTFQYTENQNVFRALKGYSAIPPGFHVFGIVYNSHVNAEFFSAKNKQDIKYVVDFNEFKSDLSGYERFRHLIDDLKTRFEIFVHENYSANYSPSRVRHNFLYPDETFYKFLGAEAWISKRGYFLTRVEPLELDIG